MYVRRKIMLCKKLKITPITTEWIKNGIHLTFWSEEQNSDISVWADIAYFDSMAHIGYGSSPIYISYWVWDFTFSLSEYLLQFTS